MHETSLILVAGIPGKGVVAQCDLHASVAELSRSMMHGNWLQPNEAEFVQAGTVFYHAVCNNCSRWLRDGGRGVNSSAQSSAA